MKIKNRSRAQKKPDKKYFSKTASKVHVKNVPSARPMRGGIRL